MYKKTRSSEGYFSIEAVLSITIFFISIIAIMFIVLLIRVQSSMQYALGQTAKEVSGYYYLLDKFGVTKIVSGQKPTNEQLNKINESIGYIVDFQKPPDGTENEGQGSTKFDVNSIDWNKLGQSIAEGDSGEINALMGNLKDLGKDPKGTMIAILSVFSRTLIEEGNKKIVAPLICRALMPKYLGGDEDAANAQLKACGVVYDPGKDPLDGIDFTNSELLIDGRSVKLVAVYKINVSNITFGIVDQELTFRTVASTAAWLKPDGVHTTNLRGKK